MSDATPLETLLRGSALTNGSINLCRVEGGAWRAVVVHHRAGADHPLGHMVHPFDDWKDDPVEALRIALVEDERCCRDLERRYRDTPKLGAVQLDLEDLLG